VSFFKELKRRNVFKVSIAYIVIAWLVMQVADVILNNVEAPGWVFRVILLLLGIGLPLAIFFAWAFELTPEGIKREHEVDRSRSITQKTSRKLDYILLGLILVGIGWLVAQNSVHFDGTLNSAGNTPVVILMDTYAPRGVYDEQTRHSSGTNADVLSDILRGLPIETHKEAIGSTWDREQQVLMQHPNLILIHRSGFFHSMNLEFGFGYPDELSTYDATRANKLYEFADNKLMTFFGLIGQGNPDTAFLVYSRGTSGAWVEEEYRNRWVARLEERFPVLTGRVNAISIPGGVAGGSFRHPETAQMIRQQVISILDIEPGK